MSVRHQPHRTLIGKIGSCQKIALELLDKSDPSSVFKRGEMLGRLALLLEIVTESQWPAEAHSELVQDLHSISHAEIGNVSNPFVHFQILFHRIELA